MTTKVHVTKNFREMKIFTMHVFPLDCLKELPRLLLRFLLSEPELHSGWP